MATSKETKQALCLMIVNENFDEIHRMNPRTGSLDDAKGLKQTLEECCACHVVLRHDRKVSQMEDDVADLVMGRIADISDYDSVWLVLSSHGNWKTIPGGKKPTHQADVIWGTDDTIAINWLTERLQEIKHKPCVIVIQACRGNEYAAVCEMEKNAEGRVLSSKIKIPQTIVKKTEERNRAANTWPEENCHFDNQILLWASLPGRVSFKPPLFFYLQKVIKENEENLAEIDVDQLFSMTCDEIGKNFESRGGRKVTVPVYNKLLSKLYLK